MKKPEWEKEIEILELYEKMDDGVYLFRSLDKGKNWEVVKTPYKAKPYYNKWEEQKKKLKKSKNTNYNKN